MKFLICTVFLFLSVTSFAQEAAGSPEKSELPKPQEIKMNTAPVEIPQPPSYIYETHKPPPGREEEVRKAEEKANKRPDPEMPPVLSSPHAKLPNE